MEEELEETGLVDYFEMLGFSTDEALLLEEKAIPKEFCEQWKKEYPRDQAEEIAGFFVLDPQAGPTWREALFELEEAQAWHKSGLSAEQALHLSDNGIGQDMAAAWHELFPESNLALLFAAAKEIAPDCSFENLAAIFALSHDQEQLRCCLISGFELPDIKLLAQAGLEGVDMARWRSEIPGCSTDLIMTFKELAPGEAAGWIHIFPTADLEDILRLVGYGLTRYDIESLPRSFSDIKAPLAILAEAGAEGREASAEVLQWHCAFPDLSFSEAKEFMEASHCSRAALVIRWRQKFPEDSAARIAEFMHACEYDDNSAFDLRASGLEPGPGMNFVKECSFQDSSLAMTWHADFPEDTPSYIREYVSCFEGDEQTAHEWRSSGLKPEDASQWWDRMLVRDPADAAAFMAKGVSVDVGVEWTCVLRPEGSWSGADDMEAWLEVFPDMTYSQVYEVAEWIHYGIDSPSEVAAWIKADIEVIDALTFKASGCDDAEMAKQWLDRGISAAQAKQLLGEQWVTPEQYEQATGLVAEASGAELMGGFIAAGFDAEQASKWIKAGFQSAETASEWAAQGFGPATASLWLAAGCLRPEVALEWWDAGATPFRASHTNDGFPVQNWSLNPQEITFVDSNFEDWGTRGDINPEEIAR
jgi:hypothetical protein